MPAGRPPIFETPEQLETAIDAYIADESTDRTVTGLAIYLGFESRQSMYDYEKKPEFSYLIKKALLIVENGYEKKVGGTTPTGAIFVLKNMGWKDKTEQEISGSLNTGVDLSKLSDEALKQLRDAQNTNGQ